MGDDFVRAAILVLGIEGDDKIVADSGGLTKFGISQRAYPSLDIRSLTRDQALAIYRRDYWLTAHCDEMSWPLSLFVFDCAVNQGVGAAIKLLQKALGVAQDGLLGAASLAAMAKLPSGETCALYLALRALRYTGTKDFDVYGKGWLKRLFTIALAADMCHIQ